jgi:3-oxo-5alpha-steroid 4-dehydrogenase
MDRIYIARHVAPPPFVRGILVNAKGERFIGEDAYIDLIGGAITKQAGARAWLILRTSDFWSGIWKSFTRGLHTFKYYSLPLFVNILLGGTKRGSSLEAVASAAGIDAVALRATAEGYDRDLRQGAPDPLGKADSYRELLGDGPFYALNLSVSNPRALTPFQTLGGLVLDEESGAVLRADGSPISGLYAAGTCAMGLCSNGYISGLSIADGVFSGRRAARTAASAAREA